MDDLKRRLRERADIATAEGTATATGDALHFREAAAAIEALQAEVTRLRRLDVEYGRVEMAIIMADPQFDGDSDHANCADRLIASVQQMKAQLADEQEAHAETQAAMRGFIADLNEARDKALEDAAMKATGFLVGHPAHGQPLRNPMSHEIAAAIRAMKGAA